MDLFIVHLKTWTPVRPFMMDLTVQLKNSKGFCKLSVNSVDGWGWGVQTLSRAQLFLRAALFDRIFLDTSTRIKASFF